MVTVSDILGMIEPIQIFVTLGAAVNFGTKVNEGHKNVF